VPSVGLRLRSATSCGLTLLLAACAAPTRSAPAELAAALAELTARTELAGGRIGVCVLDATSGERLLAVDADRGFAPASNMKLVTAAVALTSLGPRFTMPTEVWCGGEVREGALHGDLVLRGHGDPTLGRGEAGRMRMAKLVAGVRERGITRIVGRVVGDDAWLGPEHLGLGWQWDYLDEDYAAPFGALCCAGNVVTLRVRMEPTGPVVAVDPPWYPVRSAVEGVAAGGKTSLRATRALGAANIDVTGTIAADARPQVLRVAVADPTAFAVDHFTVALREAGITIDPVAPVVASRDTPRTLVARVGSPPLAELLVPLLRDSDNLIAENVARVAARESTGDGGTSAVAGNAATTLTAFGIDPNGLVAADGSGLSRRNLVRPSQLAQLLLAMQRSPHGAVFAGALPVAGESGTLRARFDAGPARGRVRAKTGFISRVVCLSGYVPSGTGEASLVFSVMLNDFTCDETAAKAAVDAFVQRLATFADESRAIRR